MDELFLLVGLGNPGKSYERTRHNLGFMVIDELAGNLDVATSSESDLANVKETSLEERKVILAKPMTYMNRSGLAVSHLVNTLHVSLSNLLIILDDFNLPFGALRMRRSGSDGGHRGLESIIMALETAAFPRLRIGIGAPEVGNSVDFVLDNFDAKESRQLSEVVKHAAAACLDFVDKGLTETMNKYNSNND